MVLSKDMFTDRETRSRLCRGAPIVCAHLKGKYCDEGGNGGFELNQKLFVSKSPGLIYALDSVSILNPSHVILARKRDEVRGWEGELEYSIMRG